MNNDFKKLLDQYSEEWKEVASAQSLEQLESAYTNSESTREEILIWVFENISDENEQGQYFSTFGELENHLWENVGDVPIFDETFDVYDSFDDYESYYQRYGCLTPEFVISWDGENVLFTDGEIIEIIARPDVLMNGSD
jgi:hypothetical protein